MLLLLLATQSGAQSGGDRAHPLIGRIWDVRAAQFIDERGLQRRLADSTFVLLGETHDNAEHHRVQRDLIGALVEAGRRPAIAMEQFDREHQSALDRARAERPRDSHYLKTMARFNDKGWRWASYEPIVELALAHGLPLLAANLSRAEASRVVSAGVDSLGAPAVRELGLDRQLDETRRESLEREIHEGHCGKAPATALRGMIDAQRARDAVMAQALAAHREEGGVLIAGNGHVRRDFGVPYYLERLAPEASISSLGLVEIRSGLLRPDDYPAKSRFDFLWFTPAIARDDPCAQLKFKPG
jgi:uncharacterized iron-regulated protein